MSEISETVEVLNPVCPYCNTREIVKHGFYDGRQRWICLECRKTTTYIRRRKRIDGKEKRERNDDIARMRGNNPHLTLEEIGNEYGISRQRVWEILRKHRLDA